MAVRDDDEEAKRFDLVILKIQLAMLDGDHLTADRLRQQVQQIALPAPRCVRGPAETRWVRPHHGRWHPRAAEFESFSSQQSWGIPCANGIPLHRLAPGDWLRSKRSALRR